MYEEMCHAVIDEQDASLRYEKMLARDVMGRDLEEIYGLPCGALPKYFGIKVIHPEISC